LNTTQLAALRLTNHRLFGTQLQTPEAAVAWMGAMQAQDFNMVKRAVGIRLANAANATDTMVEDAFNQGRFLRTHVLRPTWHFVAPENIRWMLDLSAARIKSSSKARDRDLEITETLYTKTNRIIATALEGRTHLTREDLAKELEKANINADTPHLYHFLMRAELEGLVCSGAMQGKTQTYALLDKHASAGRPLPREESLARLADIYFKSHGPAALRDFAWWSGLSLTEARNGLEAVKAGFVAETMEGKTYWVDPACRNVLSAPSTEPSVLFLPAFDEYIIGYSDRSAVIPADYNSKAVSSNGVFRPTIVVNGQVAGIWKKTGGKTEPIQIEFFEPADGAVKEAVDKAMGHRQDFLGSSAV
jgi:hypothetical protein